MADEMGLVWAQTGHERDMAHYVRSLESLFIEVRGRGVQWSPEDAQVALHWYHAGVELPRVAEAFAERTAAWRYKHGDRALPRSLAYYRRVRGERTRCATTPAYAASATPTADIPEPFERLDDLYVEGLKLAKTQTDRALAVATERASQALKRLRDKEEAHDDLDELLGRVSKIRDKMMRNVLTGLGTSEREALRRRVQVSNGLQGTLRDKVVTQLMIATLDLQTPVPLPWWEGWERPNGGAQS